MMITGPNATFGKLFKITKKGSKTLDKNFDHHNTIAIAIPNIVPNVNPINVSKHVTPTCIIKSEDDKLIKVFHILDGLLAIKLSITPILANISHPAINTITIASLVSTTNILFFFICLKYFFLSSDMFFSRMYIKLLPNSIKVFTKFWTFPTIYRISVFHFKIYFVYLFYCSRSICKNYYSVRHTYSF